jgi:hypothetical protein
MTRFDRLDRRKLYDSASAFFDLGGHAVMKLTPAGAIEVCREAGGRGLVVVRVEGGYWQDPGCEAKIGCIWDGADPPMDQDAAPQNNLNAANFIRVESGLHDACVLTAAPITGYEHKQRQLEDPGT